MSKFMILFHGGNIPKDKAEQSVSDRLAWMNNLRNSGKFIEGSPLDIEGKVITDQTKISTYIYNEAGVSGYAVIDVGSLDEAIQIAKSAPQVKEEYGSAMAEIRQLKPLINEQ